MNEAKTPFATIGEAAEEIRQGRMIVLVDDEDRGERRRSDHGGGEDHA